MHLRRHPTCFVLNYIWLLLCLLAVYAPPPPPPPPCGLLHGGLWFYSDKMNCNNQLSLGNAHEYRPCVVTRCGLFYGAWKAGGHFQIQQLSTTMAVRFCVWCWWVWHFVIYTERALKYNVCEKMHFVWFSMWDGFSHHSSPNPTLVASRLGWDSETRGEKNPSHMENHTKCISSLLCMVKVPHLWKTLLRYKQLTKYRNKIYKPTKLTK